MIILVTPPMAQSIHADHSTFARVLPGVHIIGDFNTIRGGEDYRVIGDHNTLAGLRITVRGDFNTIGGGEGHFITGDHNTLAGMCIMVVGDFNTITGGEGHSITGDHNTINARNCRVIGDSNTTQGSGNSAVGEANRVIDTGRGSRLGGPIRGTSERVGINAEHVRMGGLVGGTSEFVGIGAIGAQRVTMSGRGMVRVEPNGGRVFNYGADASSPLVVNGDIIYSSEGVPRPTRPVITYPDGDDVPAKDGDDETSCVLCLENGRNTAAVPCGHSYSCIACLKKGGPTTCAICRANVTSFIRIIQS